MRLKAEELSELFELVSEINRLKLCLYQEIDKNTRLITPETIRVSQMLDIVIVKYFNILKKCN